VIQKNGKWVKVCSICGPVKGENYLLPYLNKTEFLKIYPHIKRYFDEYNIPTNEVGLSLCYECVTLMELKYLQSIEERDTPLLINCEFFSDKARDYMKSILEGRGKKEDRVLFNFAFEKLKRLEEVIEE